MLGEMLAIALVFLLQGSVGTKPSDKAGIETKSFAVQPGDTLTITNNSGKIQIRPCEGTTLEIRIRRAAHHPSRKNSLEATCRKDGGTIFVSTSLSETPGKAVDSEIRAPIFMNVTILGSNSEINIASILGLVGIQSTTGRATAEKDRIDSQLGTSQGSYRQAWNRPDWAYLALVHKYSPENYCADSFSTPRGIVWV